MEKQRKSESEILSQGYIPNRRLFAYAAGIAGQNFHYQFINGWLFYFINNILKIDAKIVGYITGGSRLWDAINDPIVGVLIDRHTFKRTGEKLRPFLVYTPPLIGLLAPLMFTNWGLSGKGTIIYIIICYLLWDLVYSIQDTALWGILAVSSPHSPERSRAAQWTAIGVTVGCVFPGLFPAIKDICVNNLGMDVEKVFLIGSIIFGLGGELLSMVAGKMKELVKNENNERESFFEALFVLRHNKTMLLISLARILEYIKLTVPWAYFFESNVSYKIGNMEIGGGTAQLAYGAVTGAPGTLCMFAATKIVDRVGGMKRILILAQLSSIVLRIASYFIGYKSIWSMVAVMLIMGLQGIPANMTNIAHRSLMSDSIDYVEYKTGKRTEGITFSMQNFATKIGDSLALFVSGQLLSLVKYDEKKAMTAQGALFNKWQWPFFILGPATGAILYLIVIMFVKDDREEQKMIEAALTERRNQLKNEAKKELSEV